jgi:site-specific recombinase
VSVRILDYVAQLEHLIILKTDIHSETLWREMLERRMEFNQQRNSARRYIQRHTDLVAIEVVEHTSVKGESYIAESPSEYCDFFYRSLWGGVIISLFALFKLIIDAQALSPSWSAIWFGLNYAACFVIVKKLGGLIATKQPAMTASTIAKYADRNSDFVLGPTSDVVLLIRRVLRSQLVSLVGNFMMALFPQRVSAGRSKLSTPVSPQS